MRLLALLLLGMGLASAGLAADPPITAQDLPRLAAVEPKDAPGTFQVRKGFHVELAASEPNIASPVAVSFDERGRMFVVEMIDYSERREETPHLGRIRLLEDTKGTGFYDKSTIYAENLAWPTAVFCYDGGIFVGATPDILYLKDTNGDGKADKQEVVFTGFGEGMAKLNVQGMLNSFVWGLDNRIHGATSTDGGTIKSLRHPEAKPLNLRGRDFVIDPRTMSITAEAGGGQHGLGFDDYGRRFACNNSDHIRMYMYDDYYGTRNPAYAMPPVLASIAVDGPAAEVYRISPEEPWRVVRTRWRIAGLVPGPVEGGGRSAGYFTGATGTMIYRGDAFPREFSNNAFLGDAGGNLVHRKVLLPDGVGLKAQRAADEQTSEFAASRDTWFRPVQFANAPDGTLYVIDMYREVIEHPWSLPDSIKQFLDLNSGNDRGRIYRIAPDGFKQPTRPVLSATNGPGLLAALASPNGWHRDTAARLLYEHPKPELIPELQALAANSPSELGRIHALYALDGLGGLDMFTLIKALRDSSEWVRIHGLRLTEKALPSLPPKNPIFYSLQTMTADPSRLVRYQLAFTLGELPTVERTNALAAMARRDADNPWIQAAILSSLNRGAGNVFTQLSGDTTFAASTSGAEFLRQLALLVGAQHITNETSKVLAYCSKLKAPGLMFSLVHALGDGLKRSGRSLASADRSGVLPAILAQASQVAASDDLSEATRIQAIELLAFTSYAESADKLLKVLDHAQAQKVQLAALRTLAKFLDPAVPGELVRRWKTFSPPVRSEVLASLLGRTERARVLLDAVAANTIPATELTSTQISFLQKHADESLRTLALNLFGTPAANQRQAVITAYQPALSLKGDSAKGRLIYEQRCSSCHRLGGAGFALGPDLVTVKNTGKEKMLVNILDPNREVAPNYIAFQIETKDEESILGIIASESTTSVTVRRAFGKEDVILRSRLQSMKSQGLSLMPEGLEQGLTPQDFANLLEYISTAEADK